MAAGGMEETLVSPQNAMQAPLSFALDGKPLAYMFSNPNAHIEVKLTRREPHGEVAGGHAIRRDWRTIFPQWPLACLFLK